MSLAKHDDFILETIDQLRKRKARPDVLRICHMVERKHGLTPEETKTNLDKLVEEGSVIKVDYKGNTSYRNADKYRMNKLTSDSVSDSKNANNVNDILCRAVTSLTEPGGEQPGEDGRREKRLGASVKDVQKWILREDASTKIARNRFRLQLALHRAVDSNMLIRLDSGKYVLADVNKGKTAKTDEAETAPAVETDSPTPQTSATEVDTSPTPSTSATCAPSTPTDTTATPVKKAKGRPPTKRKKFRKKLQSAEHESPEAKRQRRDSLEQVEDKQDEPTPKAPPKEPPVVTNEPRCDFCLLTSESNRAGVHEDLLFCKDCQAKGHPSCMDYSEELARRAKNSPWQCIDCKTCFICEDSGDADAMLFCDACDKGYHMNCHTPPIKEKPTGKWVCSACESELGVVSPAEDTQDGLSSLTDTNTDGGGPSCLPTPNASPVHCQEDHKTEPTKETVSSTVLNDASPPALPRLAKTLAAAVPDASAWSIDNVVEFFTEVGFTEQAHQFKEQEIDGKSLLLMKRTDVLMGLALRLGPALKIYAHVERLQTRGDTFL